jgi:phosphoglycolate phosphatase
VGANSNCNTPVNSMIGAPLLDIFRKEYGLTDVQTDAAIDHYREHYDALGQAGTTVYADIHDVLSGLQRVGLRLFVATVKPAPIAEKVLADLQLRSYFDGVSGSSMDHRRRTKAGIIAHVLQTWKLDPLQSIMIGDRGSDITGARENRMRAIGVTYGFGSRDELQAAGPDHIVGQADEIAAKLTPG